MTKSGCVPVYRKIVDSSVWEMGPQAVQLWVWMLMEAVFSEDGYDLEVFDQRKKSAAAIHLNRGEFYTTYRRMADALRYRQGRGFSTPPLATLKRIVGQFISGGLVDQLVDRLPDHLGMVLSIRTYSIYNTSKFIGGPISGPISGGLGVHKEDTAGNKKVLQEEKEEAKDCPPATPSGRRRDLLMDAIAETWADTWPSLKPPAPSLIAGWRKEFRDKLTDDQILATVKKVALGGFESDSAKGVVSYVFGALRGMAAEQASAPPAPTLPPGHTLIRLSNGLTVEKDARGGTVTPRNPKVIEKDPACDSVWGLPIYQCVKRREILRQKFPGITEDPTQGKFFTLTSEFLTSDAGEDHPNIWKHPELRDEDSPV